MFDAKESPKFYSINVLWLKTSTFVNLSMIKEIWQVCNYFDGSPGK